MKFLSVTGVLMVMLAFLVQAPWPHGVANAANFSIGVSGFNFDPADRSIQTGDTVEWSWNTAEEHNVIFVGESEASGGPATSDTYSRTFNAAGTFNYYCEVHGTPGGGGMAGTITVQAASTNTPTNTPGQGTATRTATRTPTRTATATPTGTVQGTVTPIPSITPVTPPPPNVPSPIVTVDLEAEGGSGGAVTAPNTGSGSGNGFDSAPWWVSIALALAGATMMAGAMVMRRRSA